MWWVWVKGHVGRIRFSSEMTLRGGAWLVRTGRRGPVERPAGKHRLLRPAGFALSGLRCIHSSKVYCA